jgi:hypothetical protein
MKMSLSQTYQKEGDWISDGKTKITSRILKRIHTIPE